jgi:DNA-binding transcriptional LysR family regulator
MNSIDLAFFAAVYEAGGIGKAALHLNTVQSNVTNHIISLERNLGVPLFYRGSRGTSLTAAGERLLPYAREIAQLLENARQEVVSGGKPSGPLRIGSLETMAAFRLPPLLARYASEFPEVEFDLETGPTAHLIDLVLTRRRDAAFVSGPVVHEELESIEVLVEELVLAVPAAIGTIRQFERRVGAGRDLRPLVFRSGCSYRQKIEQWLADRGLTELRRMEFGTLDGILGCIAAGMGFSLLPKPVAQRAARDGSIGVIGLARREALSPIALIHRRDTLPTAALVEFVAMARSALSQSVMAAA